MFAKVYNFKFPGLSEAKVAATFCSERLGKKIVPFNIRSLNISIGKCGSISINLKFESGEDLNKFEESSKEFFQDLKKTFIFTLKKKALTKRPLRHLPISLTIVSFVDLLLHHSMLARCNQFTLPQTR